MKRKKAVTRMRSRNDERLCVGVCVACTQKHKHLRVYVH